MNEQAPTFIKGNKKDQVYTPITSAWDKIGKVSLYLLFGLIPIFFLPFTSFPIGEAKLVLAGTLVLVAFGSYLARLLTEGNIYIPKTWTWVALAAFLVLAGISTIMSDVPYVSLWGNTNSSDSLFAFVIYALAFFLIPMFLRKIEDVSRAIFFFIASLIILGVYSILQLFGVFVIPFDFTANTSFNPIGTVQSLAVFLGLGLVMIAAFFTSFKLSTLLGAVLGVTAAILGFILLLVNFNFVWLGIFVASALMVSWQITHSRKVADENNGVPRGVAIKLNLPLVLMIVVAILYFVNPPITNIVTLPVEVRPSLGATLDIARGTFSSGFDKVLIGSGPSTFIYEYLSYRPVDINNSAFWGIRFSQGYSTISTLLSGVGVLGLVSLLAAFVLFILTALKGIASLSRRKSQVEGMVFVPFVGVVFLLLALFFYPVNFTHFLFLFLLSGLVISSLSSGDALDKIEFSILKTQQRTFVASLGIIVLIVATIVGLYWQGQKYVASAFHTSAIASYNQDRDIDTAIRRAVVATNLDSNKDTYSRTLVQLLGISAGEILSDTDLNPAELQQRYQLVLQNLLTASQRAINANPSDPTNWRQLGSIYENNIFIVGGVDNFAIANYQEAAKRNPNNPSEYLNIARAYVLSSDSAQRQLTQLSSSKDATKEDIEKLEARRDVQLVNALDNLMTAIELKADYAPAHFLTSQVYERQGNRELAIQKTLDTRNLNPLDTGVGYQLGLLYYLDGQFTNAAQEFARIVGLRENFSNARYFLGLSYDRLGNSRGAIDQFNRVSELNPDNQEVISILGNLRSGRGALEGIVPPASPPQNRVESPVPQTGGEVSEDLPK